MFLEYFDRRIIVKLTIFLGKMYKEPFPKKINDTIRLSFSRAFEWYIKILLILRTLLRSCSLMDKKLIKHYSIQ